MSPFYEAVGREIVIPGGKIGLVQSFFNERRGDGFFHQAAPTTGKPVTGLIATLVWKLSPSSNPS